MTTTIGTPLNLSHLPTFGKRLRALRKYKGWTQEELADLAGVDKQTGYRYETDQMSPNLNNLMNIIQAFGENGSKLLATND